MKGDFNVSKKNTAIKEQRNFSIEVKILTKVHGYLKKHNIMLNKTDRQTFEAIVLYANIKTGIAYPTLKQLSEKLNISESAMKYRIKKLFERLPDEINGIPLIIKHKHYRNRRGCYANNVYFFPFLVTFNPYKNKEAAKEFTELSWMAYEMTIKEKTYIEQIQELQEKNSDNWNSKIYNDLKGYKEAFSRLAKKFNLSGNDIAEIFVSASNALMENGILDIEKYLTKALVNKAKNQRLKDFITKFNAIGIEFTNRCLGLYESNFVYYPIIKNIINSIA